jgi:nicotinate-nucleotide adenylyltransferase
LNQNLSLLFGGTFDPVHNGHLRIARDVAGQVGAARVLLIPTRGNPLKNPPQASPADRLEMLRLATTGEALFEICPLELQRDPPSYTIDTVEALLATRPAERFALLLGADMLEDLPRWRRIGDLLGQVRILVASRPPWTDEDVQTRLHALTESLGAPTADQLAAGVIQTPRIDISATQVRRRLAGGDSIHDLVPEKICNYIKKNRLYLPA